MDIEKYTEKYSSEYYKEMFGLHPEMRTDTSLSKGQEFLKKFALDNISFRIVAMPAMQKIFKPDGYKEFNVKHMSFKRIFHDDANLFSLLSSPLFWEEHFGYIKTIAKAFDDQYFYIIEDESCEEHADAALQLRIPTDISWEEMSDGGFVSDVAFNMFHNNYLVYGENGYWGRWCDYENGTIDYEVFGYKKMNPAIQHYKEWCSADIDMNEAEMIRLPKEIRQYLVLK